MADGIERLIGYFPVQHAFMIDDHSVERAKKNPPHKMGYGPGNVLLLNGNERMVVPYNLVDGPVELGDWVNQVYHFTLVAPPGTLPDRLEAVRKGLDTTLLKLFGPTGPDDSLYFVHTDYRQGNGAYSTLLNINTLDLKDMERAKERFAQNKDIVYRIESMRTADNLYK